MTGIMCAACIYYRLSDKSTGDGYCYASPPMSVKIGERGITPITWGGRPCCRFFKEKESKNG